MGPAPALHTRMRSTASAPRWKVAVAGGVLLGLCGLTFWGAARQLALRRGHPRIHPQHAELYAARELRRSQNRRR